MVKKTPTDNSASWQFITNSPHPSPSAHVATTPDPIIVQTQAQCERDEDNADNLLINAFRPQDLLPTSVTGKRKHDKIRQYYLCEGPWQESMEWLHPPSKLKKGTLIGYTQDPGDTNWQDSDGTRRKNSREETPSPTSKIGSQPYFIDLAFLSAYFSKA